MGSAGEEADGSGVRGRKRHRSVKSVGLTIAIDYDNTFNADEVLWASFIRIAIERGHFPCIVTARMKTQSNQDEIGNSLRQHGSDVPVLFTEQASKLLAVHSMGMQVDIWIDDNPKALVDGH